MAANGPGPHPGHVDDPHPGERRRRRGPARRVGTTRRDGAGSPTSAATSAVCSPERGLSGGGPGGGAVQAHGGLGGATVAPACRRRPRAMSLNQPPGGQVVPGQHLGGVLDPGRGHARSRWHAARNSSVVHLGHGLGHQRLDGVGVLDPPGGGVEQVRLAPLGLAEDAVHRRHCRPRCTAPAATVGARVEGPRAHAPGAVVGRHDAGVADVGIAVARIAGVASWADTSMRWPAPSTPAGVQRAEDGHHRLARGVHRGELAR